MEPNECNLTEVQKSRPVRNKTVYRAIIPANLSSVSSFNESSIVGSELRSTSQPLYLKGKVAGESYNIV